MYPCYYENNDAGSWLSTTDCKPPAPASFDDRSTSWITPLGRTLASSTPAHFPAAPTPTPAASTFYQSPDTSRYANRQSSPAAGPMSRCDVMESPLTSYGCVTSSLGNPHSYDIDMAKMSSSSSAGVDDALMSAALLHSAAAAAAAAAEVGMMNSPQLRTNPGVNDTATSTPAVAAALRLRTKSHSSSGNVRWAENTYTIFILSMTLSSHLINFGSHKTASEMPASPDRCSYSTL